MGCSFSGCGSGDCGCRRALLENSVLQNNEILTPTDGAWHCVTVDENIFGICGKSWIDKGKVHAAIGAINGFNDDDKTATTFKANGFTVELTGDPGEAIFSSAMATIKENLNAVVVDDSNVGMFIEIPHELDEFLLADKVIYNFKDGYVNIALGGGATGITVD